MYYEEKMIDGVLHWRGTPDGEWTPVSSQELSKRLALAHADREAMRKVLQNAPTGKKGETHGDVIARYYAWYEGQRANTLAKHPASALREEQGER